MSNWKATTKLLRACINIIKIRVRMILRLTKRIREHPKRKKGHRIVIFVYMNEVNYSALHPSIACVHQKKRPSIR